MDLRIYNPKEPLPRNQDYILDKISDYNKLVDFVKFQKLSGEKWKITLISPEIKEVRRLVDQPEPSCVELIVLVPKDVLTKIRMESPKQVETKVSKWESFLEVLTSTSLVINNSAVSKLYERTGGVLSKVTDTIRELEEVYGEGSEITVKELNAVILDDSKVYAGDILKALFVDGNLLVPPKGSMLSKYTYKKWRKLYDKLLEQIDSDFAFYSLRSQVRKMYDAKLKYLNNGDVPRQFKDLVEVVDVYEIMHAMLLFNLSNPSQTLCVLLAIEGRKRNNVGFLQRTVIPNYLEHDHSAGQ
jgi:hypothetical protein